MTGAHHLGDGLLTVKCIMWGLCWGAGGGGGGGEILCDFLSGNCGMLTDCKFLFCRYGMETFTPLIENGSLINNIVNIDDEPCYVHRGLMLDAG